MLSVRILCLTVLLGLCLCAPVFAATVALEAIDSGVTSPEGYYRWLNAADQVYSDDTIENYTYDGASVQVSFDAVGTTLRGHLSATGLKPDFAYQLKLTGESGTLSNERIGLTGRWWQEEWVAGEWTNGGNLNDKGDGSSPNPNDLVYFDHRDDLDPTSPSAQHYRYTGYLVFDYFITDSSGGASFDFEADNSYHVLWKTWQPEHVYEPTNDGPVEWATFNPDPSQDAYDIDHGEATIGIYGEWERLPPGGVFLATGDYDCQVMLTEESFHATGGTLGGGWAAAVGADVEFTIVDAAPTPGDANGDGKIDGADLAAWQQNYDPLGVNGPANTFDLGDFNDDNRVDGTDLALWQQNYDPVGGQVKMGAVPEPATIALVLLGAAAVLVRKHH